MKDEKQYTHTKKPTSEELDQIAKLWLESNIETHSYVDRVYWEANLSAATEAIAAASLFISKRQDRVIGFAGVVDGYIAGMFVEKEFRGQQVGAKLLSMIKEVHSTLSLQVYKKNKSAISFYLAQGFQLAKEQVDDETGEKELVMTWSKK